jgi:DNA primase/energy-coupling factor transporter ATP-binding protein EcfA2
MEIADIKAHLPISQILQHYNLKPDKQNRICCPFHEDKTPSVQVYYKTQTAYCFSSNCKTHGKSLDVIDFIMYKENLDKHNAILKAEQMINGSIVPQATTRELSKTDILIKMFTYFRNAVHNSNPAKEYIESRKLDYEKLEIGYNSGQFHHGQRKDETLIKQCLKVGILQDAGIISKTGDKGYRSFGKCCIVFPLKNNVNQVSSLYFRSTINDTDKRHYYLENRQGLYPCYPKPETEKLILTEAIIDAASLLLNPVITGKYSVLACYGTNGLTEEHKGAITGLKKLKEIIFFFDGDKAGKEAVSKYAALFKELLPKVKVTNVETPEGEDINSLLQGHKPEILTHLIETRSDIFLSNEKKITETQPTKPDQLDTTNPLSLKYQGTEAEHRIKGFNPRQTDSLRISLQIICNETRHDHRSKLDLYEYKQVKQISHDASERLGLRNDLLEGDLCTLTTLLEDYRDLQNQKSARDNGPKIIVNEATGARCIEFLSQSELIKRINDLIGICGVAGEEKSRILLFIIASSFKMPDTLHALIQGSSGSGKTRLLKTISSLMPPEDVKSYTRVTDNSFYNQDEYFFVHKLLCFEDLDGLKEEAQMAVRELQSNEILRTSTSIKDDTGYIRGGERTVRGPIASLACTTHGETYEDNVSRCFVIAVDESREQTLRVIKFQNERSAGAMDIKKEKETREFLQNCIRLLKPYEVLNPYANKIHLPEEAHKLRRLNELYQSFVKQITLLNQYQRKKDKQGRLITEIEDLQTACDILFESIILKVDELDGSLRQFFEKLKEYIASKGNRDYEFNRFEIRTATGVSKTQQHYYIARLVEMEYIKQFGFANRGFKYKIAWWDNMAALRTRIKDNLETQLQQLK